ncbi:DUF397 domain-containing protein [Streptomyces sp. NA04227]|uniref:DUF397 domain-containing protein n=1 Tax=Streptomyces sp. NA04227 TaxID=2742136 RepID=UPI0026E0B26B|nr:DUF397 domain-containing protein [Streptomyces sp. NA04227]
MKSTCSANGMDCVEVARNIPHVVAIRDSKRTDSPVIQVSPQSWTAFAHNLRTETPLN